MKTLLLTLSLAVSAIAQAQTGEAFAPQQQAGSAQGILKLDECRVELLKSRIIMVGASQTGVLEYVEPGEVGKVVLKDAKVAKIRDEVMQAKLEAARKRVESDIEIRYAQKSHEVATERYRSALKKRESYSPAEMMNLKLEFEKTKLQIEKAEVDRAIQALEQGEIIAELKNYEMTAPISGEVAQILKKTGESVRQGDDIMQIIDTSEIRAIGKLPTKSQALVTKGTRVRIYLLGNSPSDPPPFDNVFEGKITFLDPTVSRVSQTFDIHATVFNQKDRNGNFILKQGMRTRMEVLLGSADVGQRNEASFERSRR